MAGTVSLIKLSLFCLIWPTLGNLKSISLSLVQLRTVQTYKKTSIALVQKYYPIIHIDNVFIFVFSSQNMSTYFAIWDLNFEYSKWPKPSIRILMKDLFWFLVWNSFHIVNLMLNLQQFFGTVVSVVWRKQSHSCRKNNIKAHHFLSLSLSLPSCHSSG